MTNVQKSFINIGFVGLWFGPDLREVEIELSMCSIERRAGLCVCGLVVLSKYDTHAKKF
jgi:hypothetical protein